MDTQPTTWGLGQHGASNQVPGSIILKVRKQSAKSERGTFHRTDDLISSKANSVSQREREIWEAQDHGCGLCAGPDVHKPLETPVGDSQVLGDAKFIA